MARHSYPARADATPDASRVPRIVSLVVVWLCGIAAGMYSLLGIGVRYSTCTARSTGLVCHNGGTAIAIVMVIIVVAAVTAATVTTFRRDAKQIGAISLATVFAFGVVLLIVHWLLKTG